MKWHLVNASGGIVRTCEAESLAEARFRLAPLNGCHVLSNDSYQLGRELDVRPTLTAHNTPRKHGTARWGINEDRRKLILAANVEAIPDRHIGKAVGVSGEAIAQVRKKLGLPTADDRFRMKVQAYWHLGWDDQRIAARLGVAKATARLYCRRLGLKSRRRWGNQDDGWRIGALAMDYDVTPTGGEYAVVRGRIGGRGGVGRGRPRVRASE